MCWPLIAAEPAAVHAEHHRQLLQAYIVHHWVKRTLQECRVDRAEWLEALRRHARSEDYRVFLRDTHIEVPFRMMRREQIQRRAMRHRRRNGHQLLVLVR